MIVAPKFIDVPKDTEVVEGNAVKLKCSAQGIPNPRITWSRNGHTLTPSRRMRILKLGTLQISEAKRRDHGQYTCRAQNKVGYITKSAGLVVKSKSARILLPALRGFVSISISAAYTAVSTSVFDV